MGVLVSAKKTETEGPVVHYDYWMDGEETWNKGEFSINILTGEQVLSRKAHNDENSYGYARIQLKIKRMLELTSVYPEVAVWAS